MARKFTNLTRPAIRQLQPGEQTTEHGITAECLANGDVRYSINIMVDGERVHRTVGLASEGVTRHQAETLIEKVRTEAREGRLSLPKRRKTHLTMATALDNYLRREREGGGKNLGPKERHVRLHLKPHFKSMRLDRVSEFTLKQCRKHLREQSLSVATVNRVFATYRHFARSYGDKQIPGVLPMIPIEKEDNERDYVLTPKEEADLLTAALDDPNTRSWLFMKCGLGSALRHNEIVTIRLDRFDHGRRRVQVLAKGGRWRWQRITRELADIIQREREMARDPDGWLFPGKTTEGHASRMTRAFERCVKRAGLDPKMVTPHTLRHTCLTRFANSKPRPTMKTFMRFSGHLSLSAAMRYIHASDADVDETLDGMEKQFSGTAGREQNAPIPARKS